ncbi:hypothetical protein B0J14DRAFT_568577 [Halenospora varia]|nr:hypothetical protein B0J14DRAFT_568577 [Halenospora varia]
MHFPKMQLPKLRYQIFTAHKVINFFIISFIFASIAITIEIYVDPEKGGVREAMPGAWEDEGKAPLLEKGHSQHFHSREQKVKLDPPFQVLPKSKPAVPAPPRRSSKSNSTLKSPTPSQIQVELQTQSKSLK